MQDADIYLLNSDVEGLDQYLMTKRIKDINGVLYHSITILSKNKDFDPSHEMIRYISRRSHSAFGTLIFALIELLNLNKLIYIAVNMNDISTVIRYITSFRTSDRGQLFININKLLLEFLDHVVANETVNNLNNFFFHIVLIDIAFNNDNQYILKDRMIYSAFRLMNDSVLKNTDTKSLESFVDIALSINTSSIIIDTILKHLPDDSQYQSQQFRDNIPRFNKPSFYTSLFEENV